MYSDVPYLRFVREQGRYWDNSYRNPLTGQIEGTWVSPNSAYLLSQANDIGFMKHVEAVEYNGETLYRYSIVYPRAVWLAFTNNGTAVDAGKMVSEVAFDFSADVDKTSPYSANND